MYINLLIRVFAHNVIQPLVGISNLSNLGQDTF